MAAKLPSPFFGASSTSQPWLLLLTLTSLALSSPSYQLSYSEHCGSVVEEPAGVGAQIFRPGHLELRNGYFTGGDQLFPEVPGDLYPLPKSARFLPTRLYRSEAADVFSVQTTLRFRGGSVNNVSFVQSRTNQSRLVPQLRGRLSFRLRGFWSEASGKLCAVGTGLGYSKKGDILDLSVVVKLNYAKNSTIKTSLVSGSAESLSNRETANYFNPISIFGFSDNSYEYTLLSEAEKGCDGVDYGKQKPLSLEKERSLCSILWDIAGYGFQLEYPTDCKRGNCSPFNGSDGFLPTFMFLSNSDCKDGERMHFRLGFYNDSTMDHYYQPLAPQTTLVSEGVWDGERNRLCLVACRFVNFGNSPADASVDDCKIGLCLWVPQVLSIKDRSFVVGNMWSNRKADESGYFGKIVLKSMEKQSMRISGLKYEYTQLDLTSKSCKRKDAKKTKGKKYADGQSYGDMRFDFSVKNADGKSVWGYSNPLTYGETFFGNYGMVVVDSVSETSIEETQAAVATPEVEAIKSTPTLLNVSYFFSFSLSADFKWRNGFLSSVPSISQRPVDIFAEGIYDANTGTLCMVGCQNLGNSSMDCEIAINVQFPAVNPTAQDKLKGTIRSTRGTSDPLYFEPLELTSSYIYESQAKEWMWTMDMEMIMLLITLTLACIFIGLQLLHVKKHPDVLPSTSLLMLLVLTLGHMIHLVLNFEAFFFKRHNQQNVLSGNGGWLEVNEVIVRIITMVAFLLMFRLAQLVLSARLTEGTKKEFWISEMKAVRLWLPLTIIGALFAGFVHWKKSEVQILAAARHSVWEDLRSYCGLVLDGFLLPQILFNLFLNSYEKALSPSFYVGTTAVRSFPHAYDAYRAHHYIPHSNSTYIYANPSADLYSSTWDIIIPIGGLLFAVVVCLQQRYGGACILPRRFRQSSEYERVSVTNG